MYHRELVNHIITKINQGIDQEQIKQELINDGWSIDDVNEAFYYSAYPEKLNHFSLHRIFHSEVSTKTLIIIIILSIISFITFFYLFRNKIVNYSIALPPVPEQNDIQLSYGEQQSLTNPDFFEQVKIQFINENANFIVADLSKMIITVYDKGEIVLEVPIDSKGREGSWWETPAGLYKINKKEDRHFSGMGHVWMPWSMNFQGNFYIHGRTYYPDGTLTSKEFTGGCIRLSTDNAEKVYKLVNVGTPLLVFENSFSNDKFQYETPVPIISADSYLSADLLNNHVFTNKDSAEELPIASITKLMTALIATEYINLDNDAIVSKEALIFTSKPRLIANNKYNIYQLLFPLLNESSNEAAETIARYYGRESFIKHMNDKAKSIGMLNTQFADPSGASSENISTAEDLFMLAKYIYNNRSFIFKITSGKIKSSAYGDVIFTDLNNFNDFIDNEYFFGGKNGKTSVALETNLSVFELPVNQVNRPVVLIVLKSNNAKSDSEKVLNYTLNNFK